MGGDLSDRLDLLLTEKEKTSRVDLDNDANSSCSMYLILVGWPLVSGYQLNS
jgi:hypothetical protein